MKLRRRHRKRTKYCPAVETLEPRQLLATDLSSLPPSPDFTLDVLERTSIRHFAELHTMLGDVHAVTGVQNVQNTYGLDGRGQTVVVIDSGVAWDHQALGAGFGAAYPIVGGWDFAENDANPYDDGPAGFHGTHVTGIIASRDPTYRGVAPGVDIVALRVFDDNGAGYFSWVEQALRWVYQKRNAFRFPITTVNMSLGTEWNSTGVPGWSTIEDELSQLKAANIVVTVAAGNSFARYQTPGLSYPASSPYVIPVMSISNSGTLSSFSQRHSRAIAAPGERITSTVPDYTFGADGVANDFGTASGTSMAAPYLAGVTALIRQAMQFVHYASVTPEAIYQHLRNTADSFFDQTTQATYLRVNVQRAVDSLMPADDVGNTAATAHQLGNASGTTTFSGTIHRLDDIDYFTFTATASGTINVDVTAYDWLVPQVQLVGSAWNSGSLTFTAVAGQSYTVGVRTAGGIGHYDLKVTAPSSAAVVDWGTVSQMVQQSVAIDASTWYQAQASRDGWFTVEALAPNGTVGVEVKSATQEVLGRTTNGASSRLDLQVRAGQVLLVHLTGTATLADLRLTNLVQRVGSELRVFGTAGADMMSVRLGTIYEIEVNGARYAMPSRGLSRITLSGNGGSDSLTIRGSTANEVVTLAPANLTLSVNQFVVSASGFRDIDVSSGGGSDQATLYDSAGNDTLVGDYQSLTLSSQAYRLTVRGFATTSVVGSNGYDSATLYDSAANDSFTGQPNSARLQGPGYAISVRNFKLVRAASVRGGSDVANLYDSSGNDQFTANAEGAVMQAPGFRYEVTHFLRVTAYASRGYDMAQLLGSNSDDVYENQGSVARFYGASFDYVVQNFDSVTVDGQSGADRASLVGGRGSDYLQASPTGTLFVSQGVTHILGSFENVRADGGGGRDTAVLTGSSGSDQFYGYPSTAWLTGDGYRVQADRFSQVTVYGSGGIDTASLSGSGRGDRLRTLGGAVLLSGSGYSHTVVGFATVSVFRSAGGRLLATVQNPTSTSGQAPRLTSAPLASVFLASATATSPHTSGQPTWTPFVDLSRLARSHRREDHDRLMAAYAKLEPASELQIANRRSFSIRAADALFARWM